MDTSSLNYPIKIKVPPSYQQRYFNIFGTRKFTVDLIIPITSRKFREKKALLTCDLSFSVCGATEDPHPIDSGGPLPWNSTRKSSKSRSILAAKCLNFIEKISYCWLVVVMTNKIWQLWSAECRWSLQSEIRIREK